MLLSLYVLHDLRYFLYEFESGDVFISPTSQNFNILKNGKENYIGTIVAKQVNSDSSGSFNIKLCTMNQFGDNSFYSKNMNVKIKDSGIIIPQRTCGNGVCDSNENYAVCPQDCKQRLECEGNHKDIINGQCSCEEGFVMLEDDVWREYCEKEKSNLWIAVLIGSIGLILAISLILWRMRRK